MTDLETRILDLLREAPGRALPVREVHRVLTAELGPRTGSLAQFHERLRTDPGPLLMVEPESPLGDGADWPAGARPEYERALRDAGLETEAWLTTAASCSDPRRESPDAEVAASLLMLWEAADGRPALRAALASALAELRTR
jgi:hypothetical protein